MYPLITIQILNWNRAEETQRAIQSAFAQTYPNIEIVMVDNGSTDNSVELTKQNFPSVKVVQLDKNYGCPGGRNLGIEHCNGDYIFYLDNDGVLHKDAVENAYNTISSNSDIGIIAGVVYDFTDVSEIDTECTPRSTTKSYAKLFKGGICMHLKTIYAEIGTYPPHFMYGAEEYFLSLKAIEKDIKIVNDESVILWHKRSSASRNRAVELKNLYFNKLYTSVVLFPADSAIKFALYFIPTYISYAKKEGVLKHYLKNYLSTYIKTIKLAIRHRDPISTQSYKAFRKLKKAPL